MVIKSLRPCPICGKKVHITESLTTPTPWSSRNGALNYAKIECPCGLTFEKEWYSVQPQDGFVVINDDIYTAWNCRAN